MLHDLLINLSLSITDCRMLFLLLNYVLQRCLTWPQLTILWFPATFFPQFTFLWIWHELPLRAVSITSWKFSSLSCLLPMILRCCLPGLLFILIPTYQNLPYVSIISSMTITNHLSFLYITKTFLKSFSQKAASWFALYS